MTGPSRDKPTEHGHGGGFRKKSSSVLANSSDATLLPDCPVCNWELARRNPREPQSLLAQAICKVCPMLGRCVPPTERLRIFWNAVKTARHLGALDRVESDFFWLAIQSGLIADLGGRGFEAADQLQRVLECGLRGEDPAPADFVVDESHWRECRMALQRYQEYMKRIDSNG